jgi:hypothetical protein
MLVRKRNELNEQFQTSARREELGSQAEKIQREFNENRTPVRKARKAPHTIPHTYTSNAHTRGQGSFTGTVLLWGGEWEGKDFSARERAKSIVPDFRPVDGRDTVRTVCAGRPYARASPGKCCRPHRDFGPVFRRGGGGVLVSAPPYCVSKHSRTRAWNAHCERNKGESAVDVS